MDDNDLNNDVASLTPMPRDSEPCLPLVINSSSPFWVGPPAPSDSKLDLPLKNA
jgi:hypothetical protein